jgi:hypothetical protein
VASLGSVRAYRARRAHFGQLFRSLRDHIYSPLQFALQVGDVHLVGDAIGVADALHIDVYQFDDCCWSKRDFAIRQRYVLISQLQT